MLELKGVSRVVEGRVHVHPTDLTLERGTMNVLLGPTLSGKTTLMRLMAGLDKPTTGSIHHDGRDVTGMRVQDRGVAMVYQQFINYPGLSVFENIASPLRLQGVGAREIDARVREIAEMLRLTPMLKRKPLELSGGQQQRCALARALVKGASLVLLDEPLANLDYKLREELRVEIPRIFEASGAIFVYATTEPEEALLLGGRTAALWEGRVTQFGLTPEVYRSPADMVTARVFSDPPMNFLPARMRTGQIEVAGSPPVPVGAGLPDGEVQLGFRANHLSLTRPDGPAIALECRLGVSEFTGAESYLHLRHGEAAWVALVEGLHRLEPGSMATFWLEPRHALVFDSAGRLQIAQGGL